MRSVALVLLLASTGSAVAYPFVVPKRSGAEAEFRKRNPQHWTVVETDKRGLLSHVATDDPSLTGTWDHAKVVAVRDLLRANADLFGFTPQTAARLPEDGLLMDEEDGALMGEINVQHGAGLLDITALFWVDAKPTIDQASVKQRVAGKRYKETIGYAAAPQRDCRMSGMGAKGCATPVRYTRTREVTVDADSVEIFSALLRQGNTIRLVACADVRAFEDPAADPAWGDVGPSRRTFTPLGNAPALPLVVDRVTGQVLQPGVKSCYDPALMDPRQRDQE
jgi:hypothetical protein